MGLAKGLPFTAQILHPLPHSSILAKECGKGFWDKEKNCDKMGLRPSFFVFGLTINEGAAFIPLCGVLEKMGAAVSWNRETQSIAIKKEI